ncbi:MAG TPA: metalloregulator ArsR/SmtB family transcription factor [Kiritimatiellia bacterium]|nr:metalloregulator ArsR/SmtB family transcription factor [Kiritimatiellia bacterium]
MRNDEIRTTLRVTKALSDKQRIRIMMLLRGGELCVCRIVEVLGLAPSTVSKHLSILSDADLVDMRKEGRWAHYRLVQGEARKAVRPVLTWLEEMLEGNETVVQDYRKLADILEKAAASGKSVPKEC